MSTEKQKALDTTTALYKHARDRAIVNHARRDIGITVPPGVAAMHERTHHNKAIRNAAKTMRAPPGPGTTHASMITEEMLVGDGNFL